MAANNTKLYPPASSKYGYTLSIEGYEVGDSWNIPNNTSNVYINGTISAPGTASFSTNSNHTLQIYYYDNNTYPNGRLVNETVVKSLNKNQSVNVSATIQVEHQVDGSLNAKLEARWIKSGTNKYVPISGSVETSWFSCYTIPRASTISIYDFYVEDGLTIRVSRASSTFVHNLYYQYQGQAKKLLATGIGTEYNWKPNIEEFYGYITSSSLSGSLTIFCETYNNGTKIGDSQQTCIVKMKEYTPTLSLKSIKDINPTTTALTGNENKMILGNSNIQIETKYSTKTGASIHIYTVQNGNYNITDNPGTFEKPNSSKFIITVIDTRNRSKSIEVNMSVQEYTDLIFKRWSIDRKEATSNTIHVNFTLSYFNGNFGVADNTLGGNTTANKGTIKLQYMEGTTGNWQDLDDIIVDIPSNSNEITYDGDIAHTFDYNKAFQIKLSTFDKLKSVYISSYVTQGIPLIDKGDGFVDIHGELTTTMFKMALGESYKYKAEFSAPMFIPSGQYSGDLNDLQVIGFYNITWGATNTPYDEDIVGLCIVLGATPVYTYNTAFYQIFFAKDGDIYYRTSNSSTQWTDWKTIRAIVG